MKTHKSPRKPGMHSIHDQKGGSGVKTMHSQSSVSTKTIVIIAVAVVAFLVLMYLTMAG